MSQAPAEYRLPGSLGDRKIIQGIRKQLRFVIPLATPRTPGQGVKWPPPSSGMWGMELGLEDEHIWDDMVSGQLLC